MHQLGLTPPSFGPPVYERPLPGKRFWTRKRVALVAVLLAGGAIVSWPTVRAAAEEAYVYRCVVHHSDKYHVCGNRLMNAHDFCDKNPDAYADKPAPAMPGYEETPSCVTSYLYDHRGLQFTTGTFFQILFGEHVLG